MYGSSPDTDCFPSGSWCDVAGSRCGGADSSCSAPDTECGASGSWYDVAGSGVVELIPGVVDQIQSVVRLDHGVM